MSAEHPSVDQLLGFLVRGLVDNPDDVQVSRVEGDATLILELSVHPEDVELVRGESDETLRDIRSVLSAASGRRKAIVELVDSDDVGEE